MYHIKKQLKIMQHSENRLIPLEAFRGIAAFIVLIHHYFLAFSPYTTGFLEISRNNESLIGQSYFAFLNGTAAVIFFFTLSGFVLCWSYFNHENPRKLFHASIKRFPRLVAIVTITTISSFILFKFDLYYFHEASKLSLSPWLGSFSFSGWTTQFEPNFLKALIQGLTTFFTGQKTYNPVLWTMKPEFFGSMVVFILAYFISIVLGYRHLLFTFIILAFLAICFSKNIFPFIVGTFLSAYLAKNKSQITFTTALTFNFIGLYMLGYLIPEKAYAWASIIPSSLKNHFQTSFHTLGSIFIIYATMANQRLFQNLNGRFFKLLGKLSFSIYLIHFLVICSVSSYVFMGMTIAKVNSQFTLVTVFFVTLFCSIGLALPLSKLDDYWVRKVNVITNQFSKK
jgi:peptidoglycan/LPS O-acetylase OafA/YrhL